jgi:tRNA modification GTPase
MGNTMTEDTIVAPATSPGGAIAVIRMSGSRSRDIISRLFDNHKQLSHARMVHGRILASGRVIDEVMAVCFEAPHSFTGEDSVELYCHASAFGLYDLLNVLIQNGARTAQPGEFTKRAFLNGKMDLTQAEAVCDFIAASSGAGARAAQSQLQGSLRNHLNGLQDQLGDLIAEVEAAVEYPEEDLELSIIQKTVPYLTQIRHSIQGLADSYETGKIIKDGLTVAIAGKPNVGKSTLFNALAQKDRAIVSPESGTTRDTIDTSVSINGLAINLQDTAGIRNAQNSIEAQGVERSRDALKTAQLTLFVLDASVPVSHEDTEAFEAASGNVIILLNKTDLNCALTTQKIKSCFGDYPMLQVSGITGNGIAELRNALYDFAVGDKAATEGVLITNVRHKELLAAAAASIADALQALESGMDMDCVTIDLNAAWLSLGGITGNTVTEEIIDKIFNKFCLGK